MVQGDSKVYPAPVLTEPGGSKIGCLRVGCLKVGCPKVGRW